MSRTDTQLFDDIEKVRNHPSFVEEEDGWYASTSLREPWGPYPSLQCAVRAVVADALDVAAP
ncbi:hypothetical protein ACJRO0_04855 [Acetobacter oryzifermentans]|uniref:hypothetical protein n=1 Tax=Acetobacter oryzifermentans TaxID=1633874 RepID=UPI0039BFBE62